MTDAFVLLFENERAVHRECIFCDSSQNSDTLSDPELIARYRFPRNIIIALTNTLTTAIQRPIYR